MLEGRSAINLSAILSFIEQRQPDIAREIAGALPPQLEVLQHRAPVPLPKNYVEFLRCMGSVEGGFRVFPEHYYLLQDLLDYPKGEISWDPHRFFLIGFQDPRQVREDPHALFFDLARGDSIDAPIVGFQPGPSPTEMSIEHGIADWLIFRVAWQFGMSGKPARARLISWCNKDPGGRAALHRQCELEAAMGKLGFEPCLPSTPYSWFGKRDNETFSLIQVDPDDDMVSVELRGDAYSSVLQASEVIEDQALAQRGRVIGE